MAGRGPAPKDPSRRARSNSDPAPLRVISALPVAQPNLPPLYVSNGERLVKRAWPARTVQWWAMWSDSPLSSEFTSTDWSELLDTARLHALFWLGLTSVASELRLRVAKFGATPEDRARLRITFAQADEAEGAKPKQPSSRERRGGGLTVVPEPKKPRAPVARRRSTG